MPLRFRARRAIALIIPLCVVLYLFAPYKLLFGVTKHIPSSKIKYERTDYGQLTLEPVDPNLIDGIQSFWGRWSQVIHQNRPSPKRIFLDSNAPNIPISPDEYGTRRLPVNRVRNSEADVESMRVSHAAMLSTLNAEDPKGDMFNGTGIVTVGGGEYYGPAIIGLLMLRKTGCTLPVEIFVANDEEYESALCEDYLPRYGARCHVLAKSLQGGKTSLSFDITHYQLKSLAILFSSFAEVLYLDSDSIPLLDPTIELFGSEPYKSSGMVIWPDFWISTESPHFYTIAGLSEFPSNLPKTSSETGQLLVNKRTHLKALLLAVYYNIYGPDWYYPLLSQGALGQGDKETFMAAALVTEAPFYRVKTDVQSVSRHNGKEIRWSGMIQHNPTDDLEHGRTRSDSSENIADVLVRPAFLHANTPKMNAGHLVDEGDLFTTNGKKRLRLWGSKADQEKRFGYDLERKVWELLLQTGCELEEIVLEWKERKDMCSRLEAHWDALF